VRSRHTVCGTIALVLGAGIALPANAGQGPTGLGGGTLAAAKTLYATASYEEALTRLSKPDAGEDPGLVDQYRALCLLALGRTDDAQRALEQIVTREPRYKMTETDVSPRLVSMFHDVRRRVLPLTARGLYTRGKSSFEKKDFASASAELTDLLSLLDDADLADDTSSVADLKQLADGFLKLSEAELTAAAKAAAPPVPAPQALVNVPAPRPIYTATDRDVTPPVELERTMPRWVPPNGAAQRITYRGVLEIVINETGAVQSATIREPSSPFYDPLLVEAAKTWKFRPALVNGEPVKYRKFVEILLKPQ
jgi:TonB family protein